MIESNPTPPKKVTPKLENNYITDIIIIIYYIIYVIFIIL